MLKEAPDSGKLGCHLAQLPGEVLDHRLQIQALDTVARIRGHRGCRAPRMLRVLQLVLDVLLADPRSAHMHAVQGYGQAYIS